MWPYPAHARSRIPPRIRDLLNEYPDLLDRLQYALDEVVIKQERGIARSEVAIWTFRDILEGFLDEARDELAVQKDGGDAQLVCDLEEEVALLLSAGSRGDGRRDLSDLITYVPPERISRTRRPLSSWRR